MFLKNKVNNMDERLVSLIFLLGSVLSGAVVYAEGEAFTPTEEQKALLAEGIEYAKELREAYTHQTMKGVVEYRDSDKSEIRRFFTGNFFFAQLGGEYCLIETQSATEIEGETRIAHSCRLITPKASYRFLAQGTATYVLDEKIKVTPSNVSKVIDEAVLWNWEIASTPYRGCYDLSLSFDIATARKTSPLPMQGGYIKGIKEESVAGERIVTLKMGYYYGDTESNGEVSFYRDRFWAVKNSFTEGIDGGTGKADIVFKISNEYDFSDTLPKLKKTSIESWDISGKVLFDSKVATITSIDFTPPNVEVFDAKRYVGSDMTNIWGTNLSSRPMSPWRIAAMVIGIVLILGGLWLRFKQPREAK